jgi:hypothetical protein
MDREDLLHRERLVQLLAFPDVLRQALLLKDKESLVDHIVDVYQLAVDEYEQSKSDES